MLLRIISLIVIGTLHYALWLLSGLISTLSIMPQTDQTAIFWVAFAILEFVVGIGSTVIIYGLPNTRKMFG